MNNDFVLRACVERPEDAVLAVICGIEGPSYRPLGAMMCVLDEKHWVGSLSSGCIEADIALHANKARQSGDVVQLRYGHGSPFIDIALPCGGGLDILLVPKPDITALKNVLAHQKKRQACVLMIDGTTGAMRVVADGDTKNTGDVLCVRFEPELQFLIFGKGPEARAFAALVTANDYPSLLMSPDEETLTRAGVHQVSSRHLLAPGWPKDIEADARTAIVLFFHDHDWEPEILLGALKTDAFYIGAQGSRATRERRHIALAQMGARAEELVRLRGPIGLIPSVRDARTLAVSVLAEILDCVRVR